MRFGRSLTACAALLAAATNGLAQTGAGESALRRDAKPIQVWVDARDAPRKLLHARLTIPAAPGPLTLCYPKWLPGEHGPTGPVVNVAGLKIICGGRPLAWRRDLDDMYSIHCDVPAAAEQVEVRLDYLSPVDTDGFTASPVSTARLAVINWNLVLVYPKGRPAAEWACSASLRLPAGWTCASSLTQIHSEEGIQFQPVSLATLVDSPVLCGAHLRSVPLSPDAPLKRWLHIASDTPPAQAMADLRIEQYRNLIVQAEKLFGGHHYDRYDFLLALSDHLSEFGLEHHQCSDNRMREQFLIDDELHRAGASLLPHEYVHSWNGKFRRPAGLTTPDFQTPMRTDLLWVYEGLTEYFGSVLTARCELWTSQDYRDHLAQIAADLDLRAGRTWRSLQDTCDMAQTLYGAGNHWAARRRGTDFYDEGELLWLEADVVIRTKSAGKRSLDDFCRRFFGGSGGPHEISTFTFDDVTREMNAVQPYDWKAFFRQHLDSTDARAPVRGIADGGWQLSYDRSRNPFVEGRERSDRIQDWSYSLGLTVKDDGTLDDVLPGRPADAAGLAPGMKITAVNGRRWSREALEAALDDALENKKPIDLSAENGEFVTTHSLRYSDGRRHPHLKRDEARPDLLSRIIAARP